MRGLNKETGLMGAGDAITLESAKALTLRVLPTLDEPFDMLVEATAGYQHLCCEQTAAKILSAVLMVLTAKSEQKRRLGEKIVLAGIAREKRMVRPNGFALYPESGSSTDYYGRLAVRYLWQLRELERVQGLPVALVRAAKEGLTMADSAARSYGMSACPEQPESMEDVYLAATSGAEQVARRCLPHVKAAADAGTNPVSQRMHDAYAAATYLKLGEIERGIELANSVTRQLNDQGRLYSTVDSVAAIALFVQLDARQLFRGGAKLKVNGQPMPLEAALALGDAIESVEVLEGHAAVQVVRLVAHEWRDLGQPFPVDVAITRPSPEGKKRARKSTFKAGERANLSVALPDGYRDGDLVHVVLPPCTACIEGGGKVRQLTVDFAGKSELDIPLVVTSTPRGGQHYSVCVRNMFDESRAASPGLLRI